MTAVAFDLAHGHYVRQCACRRNRIDRDSVFSNSNLQPYCRETIASWCKPSWGDMGGVTETWI
jgi:hypothetical protein